MGNEVISHKLYEKISGYNNFAIYGAGYMAEKLFSMLKGRGCQPLYFVVTSMENNPSALCGIPVYELSDKWSELLNSNILVVISVLGSLGQEIANHLVNLNIDNTVSVSQYLWEPMREDLFWDKYADRDFGWYISKVNEWHFDKYGKYLDGAVWRKIKKENGCRIAFVVNNLSPRVVKIASALQECGREVTIFLGKEIDIPIYSKFYDAMKKENLRYIFFGCVEELIFFLTKYKCDIIHIFSHTGYPYIAYILIKFRRFLCKTVFENYDIGNGFYIDFKEEELELERYCLKNADGVCYREFSLEYLTNVLRLEIADKTLRFFDYCLEKNFCSNRKEKDQELSICYAGGVVTEEEYSDCPFGGFLEMAEKCEKNKCHLHIYPTVWSEELHAKYIEKDQKSQYFHFHKTLPYDKLIKEISQYDYGITPTRDGMVWKKSSGYNTKYKYIYAGTNKYFDYLEAGLPIITALPVKFAQWLAQEGALIYWTNSQYDFMYLRNVREVMRENVRRVREQLKVSRHIDRLLKFYNLL